MQHHGDGVQVGLGAGWGQRVGWGQAGGRLDELEALWQSLQKRKALVAAHCLVQEHGWNVSSSGRSRFGVFHKPLYFLLAPCKETSGILAILPNNIQQLHAGDWFHAVLKHVRPVLLHITRSLSPFLFTSVNTTS